MASNPPAPPPTPATADPRDTAFVREVDEAYRQDEMQQLVRRYGRWVLLALFIVLAGVGGWLFWKAEQTKRLEAVSEQFTLALDKIDSGDSAGAQAEMTAIAGGSSATYAALAGMANAGLAASGGDYAAAGKTLEGVAGGSGPQPLRDAALLNAVRMQFDSLEPAEVLKRTQPYLEGDSPWFPVAGELAALAHLKAGEPDKAGPIFLRIAQDRQAPQSLRNRAAQMASSLGLAVPDEAEEPAAAADGAASKQ